jgi:hypothetical protein
MVFILIALAAWYPALVGLGRPLLALSHRGRQAPGQDALTWSALAGMLVLSVLVTLLNFFTPIRPALALVLFGLGWGLLIFSQLRWKVFEAPSPFTLGLAGLLLAALAWMAAQSPFNYETGLYQLPSVKWLTESRATPGLANLLGQFGFNSAWFSYAAALELPFLERKSTFLANPLILLAYGIAIGQAARRFTQPDRLTPADGFLALNIIPWLSLAMGVDLNSLSSDLPITVLTLLSIYKCTDQWQRREVTRMAILEQFVLVLFAISIKLSAFPLLLTVVLLLFRRYSQPQAFAALRREAWSIAAGGLAAPVLILGGWSARSLAYSGCVVFPVAGTCLFALPWAAPQDRVQASADYVRDWARMPWAPDSPALASWDWLKPWLERTITPASVLVAAAILFLGAALIVLARGRAQQLRPAARPAPAEDYLTLLIMPLGGIGFWFATAPAVRFAEGYFWSAALLVLGGGVGQFCRVFQLNRFGRHLLAAGLAALVFLTAIWPGMAPRGWTGEVPWITNEAELRLGREALLVRWPALPEIVVVSNPLPGGGVVYTPESIFACWDAPLPCAPALDPQLRAKPGDGAIPGMFYIER